MVDYRSRFLPETMRTIDSSTITGSFQVLGSPLEFASRMLIFVNDSTEKVFISWDGVNSHLPLVAGATVVLDMTSNAVANAPLSTSALTQFYVKGTASAGSVDIATFYAY